MITWLHYTITVHIRPMEAGSLLPSIIIGNIYRDVASFLQRGEHSAERRQGDDIL